MCVGVLAGGGRAVVAGEAGAVTPAWSKRRRASRRSVAWQLSQLLLVAMCVAFLPVACVPLWQVTQVPVTPAWLKVRRPPGHGRVAGLAGVAARRCALAFLPVARRAVVAGEAAAGDAARGRSGRRLPRRGRVAGLAASLVDAMCVACLPVAREPLWQVKQLPVTPAWSKRCAGGQAAGRVAALAGCVGRDVVRAACPTACTLLWQAAQLPRASAWSKRTAGRNARGVAGLAALGAEDVAGRLRQRVDARALGMAGGADPRRALEHGIDVAGLAGHVAVRCRRARSPWSGGRTALRCGRGERAPAAEQRAAAVRAGRIAKGVHGGYLTGSSRP